MTKKRVFILGAGFMQGVAIRAARALGCTVIAADGNPNAACAAQADEFVHIDLKDTARLIDHARYLQQHGGLDAVFTAATDFSAAVAAIAAACGLRGHRPEAALNATDKVRMRECFRKAGVPSPAFTELTAEDMTVASPSSVQGPDSARAQVAGSAAVKADPTSDNALEYRLGELAERFPLVVKPVDNMGARGCSLVRTPAGLREAVDAAMRYSRSGRVIVEEYIEGSEFSIEGLIFGGRLYVTALADRHIFFPPYFIEMGHTIPSDCSQMLADEVISVFEQGVHALGLTDGAVKGDILARDGKAFVGEIAARLSGGYMSGWTVPYSSGLDITTAALTLALGGEVRLHTCGKDSFVVPLKQNCPFVSAERAWISIPGQVAAVSGLKAARAAPFVKDVFPRVGVGDTVVFPQNNVEKCGNVLSAAPSRHGAVQASEAACRKIVVRLKPHIAETDAFLADLHAPAEQQIFPPNVLRFAEPLGGASLGMPLGTCGASGADYAPCSTANHCASSFGGGAAVNGNPSFEQMLAAARYEEKEGFLLPDFLAAALDSARDLQGRTLKELLHQALKEEPALASVLCSCNAGSAALAATGVPDVAASSSDAVPQGSCTVQDSRHPSGTENNASYSINAADTQRKNEYWKALIRGGLQGLLYRYDCEQA